MTAPPLAGNVTFLVSNDPTIRRSVHRAERQFGLVVGGVLTILGGVWSILGRFGPAGPLAVAIGLALIAGGLLCPRALFWPNKAWMALAHGLGFVMTRVILAVMFGLVMTPIALCMRIAGRDLLGRRAGPRRSYWLPYPERHRDTHHYENMF